ncbi:hypothetical protein L9F63_020619, partial [Diploptera punctata]
IIGAIPYRITGGYAITGDIQLLGLCVRITWASNNEAMSLELTGYPTEKNEAIPYRITEKTWAIAELTEAIPYRIMRLLYRINLAIPYRIKITEAIAYMNKWGYCENNEAIPITWAIAITGAIAYRIMGLL